MLLLHRIDVKYILGLNENGVAHTFHFEEGKKISKTTSEEILDLGLCFFEIAKFVNWAK